MAGQTLLSNNTLFERRSNLLLVSQQRSGIHIYLYNTFHNTALLENACFYITI